MVRGRHVQGVREGRDRHRRRRERGQGRDQPRPRRVEPLHPVPEAARDERDPEHEDAVREHRADERGLDDVDEAVVEREQADEELGEVAERRLDRSGRAGAEPRAELLGGGADGAREHRDRGRRDDEREHGRRVEEVRESGCQHEQAGEPELDPLLPAQPARHAVLTLPTRGVSLLPRIRGARAGAPCRCDYRRTMLRRSLILASALACACALAGPALGSQLIDRNASHISLQVNRQGMALLTYRAHGSWHHVLAWGAINARVPPAGDTPTRPAGEAPARLLRRVGQVPQDHLAGLQERLPAVQRPQARLVRDRVPGPGRLLLGGSGLADRPARPRVPPVDDEAVGVAPRPLALDRPARARRGVHGLDLRRPLPRRLRASGLQGAARPRVPHNPLRSAARRLRPADLPRHARLGVRRRAGGARTRSSRTSGTGTSATASTGSTR